MTVQLPTPSRTPTSLEEFLRDCGLGAELTAVQVAELAGDLKPRRRVVLDGETLCRAGEDAQSLWLLAVGALTVTEAAQGRPRTVIHRRAPVVVGELGLVRPESRRTATVAASGHVTVYEISYACVENVASPALAAAFWKNLFTIAAAKLAESVPQRAEQNAAFAGSEALLRRFANDYALAASRTDIRADYSEVEAVVWFSDLAGFSALARQAEPAQTAALVKQASTLISDAIEDEGGHVDKFMGDGAMAWWIVEGHEHRHRQAAADQAFRASVRAREAIAGMTPLGRPAGALEIRIGIDLCKAYAGDFGSERRSAFTLIGDAVNGAARLEQARQAELIEGVQLGAVRVGEALHGLLSESHRAQVPHRVRVQVKGADFALHTHWKD